MTTHTLRTERLLLRASDAELCRAAQGDSPDELSRVLGAAADDHWPLGAAPLLRRHAERVAADASTAVWGPWLIIERESNRLVGDAGYKGPPSAAGTVEIGYSTAPAHRGKGIATEAARALVAYAFDDPRVLAVLAQCTLDNEASAIVLQRAGFTEHDLVDDLRSWRCEREDAPRMAIVKVP